MFMYIHFYIINSDSGSHHYINILFKEFCPVSKIMIHINNNISKILPMITYFKIAKRGK